MPGNKDEHPLDSDANYDAFEYVTGTLRDEERQRFSTRLQHDPELQASVQFWEEQLMMSQPLKQRAPATTTWQQIENKIIAESSSTTADDASGDSASGWFAQLRFWRLGTLAIGFLWLLTLSFWGLDKGFQLNTPNTDYIAVLTADDGNPLLTALTANDTGQLWLKWEQMEIKPDTNLQLWAQSRRDGQIRPLLVFNQLQQQYELDEATLRLIRDSSFLLLTEEEPGGSAIDEPSDVLIAKGACVRFNPNKA